MRLRQFVIGMALTAPFLAIPGAAATPGATAPLAGHEPTCHRMHGSTAPPAVDQAMHERVPRPALDQLCEPHGGHEDEDEGREDETRALT